MRANKAKSRVVRSSEERRAEIVEAAFACIQKYGYAKLTARKIADHSEMSLGHITYHFRDMNEVLVETYRYASAKLFEATQSDLKKSPQEPMDQLKAFLAAGFRSEFLSEEYLRVRIDLWSASLADPRIADVERELYESYRLNLRGLIHAVAIERRAGETGVELLTDALMATLDGMWLDWERRRDRTAIENGLKGCLMLVEQLTGAGSASKRP